MVMMMMMLQHSTVCVFGHQICYLILLPPTSSSSSRKNGNNDFGAVAASPAPTRAIAATDEAHELMNLTKTQFREQPIKIKNPERTFFWLLHVLHCILFW
jgi:hypothetical protein